MLFDSWHGLLRVGAMSALAYLALIAVLRFAGKRSLAKLNIFGLVVTVAFGSTLATIVLSKDVSFAEGVLAFAMLAGLQWAIAEGSRRWGWAESVFRSTPRLVLRDGSFDQQAMSDERVSEAEIRQAIRASGSGDLAKIAAVVLETDGSFSVITQANAGDERALTDVKGYRSDPR